MKRRLTPFFIVIAILAILVPYSTVCAKHTQYNPIHKEFFVKQGDNLWSIVSTEYPESADPWIVIDAIKAANGIEDPGNLRVGTSIRLPEVK